MAIAALGGLITSTFLSLLYFTIVDHFAQWARSILRRSTAGQRQLAKPQQGPLVE
jgi:hypothetical protein